MNIEDYPKITGATNSPETVKILYDLYAGADSELSAILTYTYQHIILRSENPEISNLIEEISITEMKHLELLGDAIMSFGGDPKYIDSIGKAFDTKSVVYCKNILHILKNNAFNERMAVKEYTNASNLVENQSLKALLLRIAEDERYHAERFEQAYEQEIRRSQTSTQTCNSTLQNDNCPKFESFEIPFDSQGNAELDMIRPRIENPEKDLSIMNPFGD